MGYCIVFGYLSRSILVAFVATDSLYVKQIGEPKVFLMFQGIAIRQNEYQLVPKNVSENLYLLSLKKKKKILTGIMSHHVHMDDLISVWAKEGKRTEPYSITIPQFMSGL